jgi:hypothetical protein
MGFTFTIKTFADNLGYAFNNTIFNRTTSGAAITYTGYGSIKSLFRGIASPFLHCKVLYFTSATLGGISCCTSGICLVNGNSPIGTVPILSGTIAYITSKAARGCNSLAECLDPAARLTTMGVEACINKAMEGL